MAITDWRVQFKALFPELVPILDDSDPQQDITDDTLDQYLYIVMRMLPQGTVCYLDQTTMQDLVNYSVAHMLVYYNVKDGYGQAKALLRAANSMSADGLSVGYSEVTRLKGDRFMSLNDFLSSTPYGRTASLYLEKMVGSKGGFIV